MSTWRDSTVVHPLANSFPMMSDDELKELAADIEKHSQREPIVFAEIDGVRTLIGGRHRLDACAMIGREAWTITVALEDDAAVRAFIISQNVHRRHLTPEQRQARLEAVIIANPEKSDRAIAKKVGVSQPTVSKTRKKMATTDKGFSVEKRTGIDGRTRKLPVKKVAKDEAQDVCNAFAADLSAAINGFAVGTPELSADERKAQYAALATDTDAAALVEEVAHAPAMTIPLRAESADIARQIIDAFGMEKATSIAGEILTSAPKKEEPKCGRPPGAKNKARAA
jgi:ParB-like chromosome segregation protein Spo0J